MQAYPHAVAPRRRRSITSDLTSNSEPSGIDEVRLEVEVREGVDAQRLHEIMRHQLGLRVRVVPVVPGTLPHHEGKRRRVVDERVARATQA